MDLQTDTERLGQLRLFSTRSSRKILVPEHGARSLSPFVPLAPPRPYNPICYEQPYALKLHRATKFHFDLRLCYHWIAFSWAIYSMPSHCPDQSCVAIQVEDHLRDNLLFEGVHQEGRRGAGPTIVVDKGVWQPLPEYLDIEESLRQGHLRFAFQRGNLLRGIWSLTRRNDCYRQENPRWALTKEEDEYAVDKDPAKKLDWHKLRSCFTGHQLEEEESDWHLGIQRFRRGGPLFPS